MTKDQKIEIERAIRLAQDDIRQLRRANEVLSAKVEMIDLFQTVLFTKPAITSQGVGEDSVWLLDRALTDLNAAK